MAKIGEKMRSVASAATCGLVSPNKSAKTKEKAALPEKTRADSSMAGIPGEARSSSSKSVRGRSSQALTKLKGQIKGQYEELVQLGTPAKRPGDPMRAIASWGDGPLGKAADFLDKADAKVSELELKAVAGALTVPVLALAPVAKAVDKHILEPIRAMTDPVQGPADFSSANRSSEKPQLFLHADPLATDDEKAEARRLMDSISPPDKQAPREQPAQRATMQEMRQFQRALREGGDYATLVKDAARLNVYIPEGKVLPNGDSTRSFGFDKGFERANRGLDPLNVFSPYIAAGRAAEHKARKDLAKREAASPKLPAKSEAALDNKETGAISGDASSVADSEAPTRKGGLRKQMDKVQDRYRTLVESRVAARNEKMPILHPDTELGARHVKARTAAQSAAAAMETVPSLILDKVVSSYTKSQLRKAAKDQAELEAVQDELEKSGLSEKQQEAFDSGILSTAASLSTESESGVHTPLSDKDFETAFSAATHGGAWATGDDYVAAHASSFEAMKGRPLSDEEIADISSDGGRFRDSSSHGRDPFADADDKSTFGRLSPYAQSTAGSDTDSDISDDEDGYRSSRYGRDPLTAPEKFTFAPPAAADDKETKI